jgi:hypothetical protein
MNRYLAIALTGIAATGVYLGEEAYTEAYVLDCVRICPAMLHKGKPAETALGNVRYAAVKVPGKCTEDGDFLGPSDWIEKQKELGVEFPPWNECYTDDSVDTLTMKGVGVALGGKEAVAVDLNAATKDVPLEAATSLGRCACWQPDAGACDVTGDDGKPHALGHTNVAQPGTFVGLGCVARPCIEVAGVPAAPAGCFDPTLCACQRSGADAGACRMVAGGKADAGAELEEGTFRKDWRGDGACVPMVCSKYGGSLAQECL